MDIVILMILIEVLDELKVLSFAWEAVKHMNCILSKKIL